MFGASQKTWLEVGLEGGDANALADEGVACAMAGAAILQLPAADVATYARAREAIRSQVDVVVYPDASAFDALAEFARLGLLEWLPVAPGCANLASYDDLRADRIGSVTGNAERDVRQLLGLASRHGLHPAYAIHEPGFVRLGAALHWRESTPAPLYRFLFSADFVFGFPPEDYALTAYLKLLDQVAPGAQWMVAGRGADILPLVPRVVAEGGHVRVGAGAAQGDDPVERAEQAARLIADCGGELAPAREVRAVLAPDEEMAGL
jgi:3-keto-5-aminohexanoate cleavage enzyme